MDKTYFDVINSRFSCRKFLDKEVEEEKINKILESGRLAPTAVNFQPQKIYVVRSKELLEELNNATRFLFNTRLLFVVCYDKSISWHRRSDNKDHGEIDASIVATHMMLACTALDLGSCYVCSFKPDMIRSILNIPDNYEISMLLPVGYKDEEKEHGTRKDLKDIVIYK